MGRGRTLNSRWLFRIMKLPFLRQHILMDRRSLLLSPMLALAAAPSSPKRPRVAAIVTEYRYYSHADVICGRIFDGYSPNGKRVAPRTDIVSLYPIQIPKNDMAQELTSRHGIPLVKSVEEAITLGTGKIAVDAVLFVGEHGDYPTNELGQKLYPRFEYFEEILGVYRKYGRVLPTFSDKHLSYSWPKAKKMYDDAKALGVPWMAGTSVTLTPREPDLTLPAGCDLDRTCVAGYGDHDAYGFHLLEVHQCMVERRKGGETGVKAVQMIEGDDVWKWRDGAGAWSKPLLQEAIARMPEKKSGVLEEIVKKPILFLVEYNDGLQGCVYMLNGFTQHWTFATQPRGASKPLSCFFNMGYQKRTLPHFDGLVNAIENLFVTGRPGYPVERTLLSTGTLAHLFDSKRAGGQRIETPELAKIAYQPPASDGHQTA